MRLIIYLLFFTTAQIATAATFSLSPPNSETTELQSVDPSLACNLSLTGEIQAGDADQIIARLTKALATWSDEGQYGHSVLCLNSAGGSLSEAMKIVDFMRDNYIATRLESAARCESACAMIFMAGSFFIHEGGAYKWRVMHPTARLGFHAPSLLVPDRQYTAGTVSKSYRLALETIALTLSNLVQNRGLEDGQQVKPSLLAEMLRTPSDDMMYIDTVDKAGRWGITVGPIATEGKTMGEMEFRRACANELSWNADESALEVEYWDDRLIEFNVDEWGGETVDVIFWEMTGEGCTFHVPEGTQGHRSAPLAELVVYGTQPINFLDPATPLVSLAR